MNWEISIMELPGKKYKVTMPDASVSETRIFSSKKSARLQFERWLADVPLGGSQEDP